MNASLSSFADAGISARYVVSQGFSRKEEIENIFALLLQDGSELTIRVLAERVTRARNLDATGTTIHNSVVFKVV